jgi:hypothetical protein
MIGGCSLGSKGGQLGNLGRRSTAQVKGGQTHGSGGGRGSRNPLGAARGPAGNRRRNICNPICLFTKLAMVRWGYLYA